MGLRLPRVLSVLYGGAAIILAAVPLYLARERGGPELALRIAAYAAVAAIGMSRPRIAPLAAGFLAALLGFLKTYRGGQNIDLGLGLIALGVGLYCLRGRGDPEQDAALDLGAIALLVIAVWSAVSLLFSIGRIYAFVPAPGFDYHIYKFNPSGFSSEQAVVQAVWGATMSFIWFGLYVWARALGPERRTLGIAVFATMLAQTITIFVQQHVNPRFLHPIGFPQLGRVGGLTSFCYALADAVLSLFLLLPLWASVGGIFLGLTTATVVMLLYGMFASGSRTAFMAIGLATLLWTGRRALAGTAATRVRRAFWAVALTTCVVLAAVVYQKTAADPAGNPVARMKDGIARQGLGGHLFATRLSTYPFIFRVMRQYPLSGVGAGLYMAEVRKLHALLAPDLPVLDPYLLGSYAPNEFLNVGVELGVVAMLALLVVFLHALRIALREGRYDLAIGVVAMGAALQFGPELYNSEGLVFFWLLVGVAAAPAAAVSLPSERARNASVGVAVLAGAFVVSVGGHLLTMRSLSIAQQWKGLRWHQSLGLYPMQPAGRWTAPQASFTVESSKPDMVVRWHAGDVSAPDYRAEVCFYVDGVLVERALASSGVVRESRLRLPLVTGAKRISIRVTPPFIQGQGADAQSFGVFIHATGDASSPS
jgi:hypothetical protein